VAVWYEELDDSPEIDRDRKGGGARRSVRIAWDDIDAFFAELFGANGDTPAPYPGSAWLTVSRAKVKPFINAPRGLNEVPNYFPGGARVDVDYAPPDRDQGGADKTGPGGGSGSTGNDQALITHKISLGGEFITWKSKNLRWALPADDDPAKLGDEKQYEVTGGIEAGVTSMTMEHTISWSQVLWPPWAAIRQCLGKTNAYPFAGALADTLLFLGAEAEREFTAKGLKAWKLDYKLSEKNNNAVNPAEPFGWNHFVRPDGKNAGQWQLLLKRPPMVKFDDGEEGIPVTALAADLPAAGVVAAVLDWANFPRQGQYRVIIEPYGDFAEECAVIAGQGTGNWVLLRGVDGLPPVDHPLGSEVWAFPGRVYDSADLRYLFVPGLPII
jgi:hypothetical protein